MEREFLQVFHKAASCCDLKLQQSSERPETLMTAKFTIHNFDLEGTQSKKFSYHNSKCNYSNHV